MNVYDRMLDASINRVSEGLRTLEDYYRFSERGELSEKARNMRHKVRKTIDQNLLISSRNTQSDPGITSSMESTVDSRNIGSSLELPNFKRVQEGLRSIEETLKTNGMYTQGKIFEKLRFESYALEKEALHGTFEREKSISVLEQGGLYLITGEEYSKGRSTVDCAKEMIKGGAKVIQYREKRKEPLVKYHECMDIVSMCREAGVVFIVNDDVDIALAVGAHGVHIGQQDMPLLAVRRIIPGSMIIGVSTHNEDQARKAIEEGADYIGVGPLYSTNTKENAEHCIGLDYLRWACEFTDVPKVAIGGIKDYNIADVMEASLDNSQWYCMVTGVLEHDAISARVNELTRIINKESIK